MFTTPFTRLTYRVQFHPIVIEEIRKNMVKECVGMPIEQLPLVFVCRLGTGLYLHVPINIEARELALTASYDPSAIVAARNESVWKLKLLCELGGRKLDNNIRTAGDTQGCDNDQLRVRFAGLNIKKVVEHSSSSARLESASSDLQSMLANLDMVVML